MNFKHDGFTLIELLFSLIIASILLCTIFMNVLNYSVNQRKQNSILNNIATANMAIHLLEKAIKQAGILNGCAKLTNAFPIHSFPPYYLTTGNIITSQTDNDITIRYAHPNFAGLTEAMLTHNKLIVSNKFPIKAGDILLIADCEHADIFKVERSTRQNKNYKLLSTPLKHLYAIDAEVSRFEINKFFVAATKRKDKNGAPIHALYLMNKQHKKIELIPEVNAMQVKYTLKQAGHLRDVAVQEVDDFSKILGVAIELNIGPSGNLWHMYVAR